MTKKLDKGVFHVVNLHDNLHYSADDGLKCHSTTENLRVCRGFKLRLMGFPITKNDLNSNALQEHRNISR